MKNSTEKNGVFHSKDQLIQDALNHFLGVDNYDFTGIPKVSHFRKIMNEKNIERLFNRLISTLEPYRNMNPNKLSDKETVAMKDIIISHLLELDEGKYFFDKPFLKSFIEKGYLDAAEDFINRVKKEDGHLTAEEIFQALRNVWIMNSLQIMWDIPLRQTPSAYAYSLLYPYTDNFLDNPDINLQEKSAFNQRLTKALAGQKPTPSNAHENRVFELVQEIESQYNRQDFASVHESILLIQEAQIESLKQDQSETMPDDAILPISIFKGGSSVLADAFLVKGHLSNKKSIGEKHPDAFFCIVSLFFLII